MNWDQNRGQLQTDAGRHHAEVGKVTDDDIRVFEGHFEVFSGRQHERYGISRDEAQGPIDDFMKALKLHA